MPFELATAPGARSGVGEGSSIGCKASGTGATIWPNDWLHMPELSTKPRNEARRRRYAEDSDFRAKVNARSRASHAAHRQQRLERQRKWWQSIGPQQRRGRGLKQYGITLEAYEKLLELQGAACAICREKFTATPLVDHCHVTRKVRGLVCRRCNTGLGCFRDDERLMMAAITYLRKPAVDDAPT